MGANGAEFQAALTNICHIFVSGNSKLLQTLTRDSDHLRLLSELYLPISQDFKTVFFYEEYKTPLTFDWWNVYDGEVSVVPSYHIC